MKALKTAGYIAILFFIQEIALRILFPLPEISNFDRIQYLNLGQEDARFTRNQTRAWQSSLDTAAVFQHEMNRYGFRDKEWEIEKPAGKKRVLFVGDSFVEGIMAPQKQTIPEGFLAAAGADRYEVMNAGMVGKGLDAYLQLTADIVPIFKPDMLVLCIYANDLGKKAAIAPPHYLAPIPFNCYVPRFYELMREARAHGPLRPVWANDTRSYFPAVPAPANPWTDNASTLQPSVTPEAAVAMQRGTFNPFRTNSYAKEEKFLQQLPQLDDALPFMHYQAQTYGVRVVIAYLPSRNQVTRHYVPFERTLCQQCPDSWDLTAPDYQRHPREIAQQCAQLGVKFIDLTPTVRQEEARGNHLFWNYDEHMRGKGYLLIGGEIARRLRAPGGI